MTTSVSLTWQEFLKESQAFLELSKKLYDDWEIYKKREDEGNKFLKCRRKLELKLPEERKTIVDSLEETTLKIEDDVAVGSKSQKNIYLIEYHILYSISYQVPMLYFKIQRSDGSLVELEDVWQIFADLDNDTGDNYMKSSVKTRSELLTMLTQMEHPVLFKPYYGIHPCKTAEMLEQMPQSKNRVLTFISLMGPLVGLNLDNRYGLSFY